MKNMNKKGSTSIFLLFILAAMVMLTAAFAYAAKKAAFTSYCDGLLQLAGKSVLSEFDLELKERYGLFAFDRSGQEVTRIVAEDADYALEFSDRDGLKEIQVDFGGQQLGSGMALKEQILAHMRFAIRNHVLDHVLGKQPQREDSEEKVERQERDRTLRNQKIIRSLPSFPLRDSSPGFAAWIEQVKSQLGDVEAIFDQTKDTYLVDRYILENFKNAQGEAVPYDTFFSNEVEYILEGNYSNKENYSQARKGILLFRSGLNAAHLYLDEEKRTKTLAAAEVLTPGPAAVLTQAAIIGTWSLAEAENDARLLERGRPVALFKDKTTWATELDAVLKELDHGCIDTGSDKGLRYEDYLMVFLHFQNETIKLARVMDLIQINLKGTYERDFLIKTHNGGFQMKAKVNGKERDYGFKY